MIKTNILSIKVFKIVAINIRSDFLKKKKKIENISEYKRRKKNRNRKRKIKKILRPILLIVPILATLIINLCGNAIVSNYKYEINSLKKDLRKEEIALDELKMEQLKYDNITNVEQSAKDKLHMNYPTKSQIRYINMGN